MRKFITVPDVIWMAAAALFLYFQAEVSPTLPGWTVTGLHWLAIGTLIAGGVKPFVLSYLKKKNDQIAQLIARSMTNALRK